MNISIIGSGNIASIFAKLILQNNHTIIQIIARNKEEGGKLANAANASFIDFSGVVNPNVDLIIVCLADSSLPIALDFLQIGNTPIVHTAGSISMNVLQKNSTNYGVLYPLQTVRKEMARIPPIPFLIEASSENLFKFLEHFAKTLSDCVTYMEESKRLRIHAAAVIVNNFTNYLYGVAETFCLEESIDFSLLKPLILETAQKIQSASPHDVQTGPAMRCDIGTIDKHLRLLNNHPKLKVLYTRLTDGIMNKDGL